jgi:hypothetical protein
MFILCFHGNENTSGSFYQYDLFLFREFSDLALKVLNECHETDERKAQNLLVRKLDNWGGATCVLIAVETQNKHFISQTACQSRNTCIVSILRSAKKKITK